MKTETKYKIAIFDFDGTLFDTGEGITECVAIALDELGYPPISQNALESFIGPSLYDSFREKCNMDTAEAEVAIQVFRKHYHSSGIYKSFMYPGMKELLEDLKSNQYITAIASSKPQVMIEKLLDKHQLFHLFDSIVGANGAEKSSNKTSAIIKSIDGFDTDLKDCIMIGDRKFDINAAKEVGIDSIYTLYGYGFEEEKNECNPTYSVNSVEELKNILL